jgi:hypothetical protein
MRRKQSRERLKARIARRKTAGGAAATAKAEPKEKKAEE